jgi:aminomuconate-semialdehyde/2-hydroxymuconate-6-semialdehyde dehydrogenase
MSAAADLCNYINGAKVAPSLGEYLSNADPASCEALGRIPRSTAQDVAAAVAAAKTAYKTWSKTTTNERAALLDKIADAIEARLDELALAESRDSGKPVSLARAVDIPRAVSNFRFFAGAIRHDSTTAHRMGDALNYTLREPIGVAALITPWNLPLYLLSWKVAPALACGNTIVAKPSEVTPWTASLLADILHDCGVPPGVFNVVHGLGGECGAALVAHADVQVVSFTGGTVTGRAVNTAAAASFKKVSLELGGKNATIVFDDADFDAAVAGATRAAFANQGQICLCGSRIFVQRGIYDRFCNAMAKRVNDTVVVGDPRGATTTFGSLSSHAHRDKVASYVTLAREDGAARVLCGGGVPGAEGTNTTALQPPFDKGAFYLPTIVAGLAATHRCATEEIFGPVVTIHPFDSEAEVIAIHNESQYGLAGSVWTQNLSRAHRVAATIETGMLWINCWLVRCASVFMLVYGVYVCVCSFIVTACSLQWRGIAQVASFRLSSCAATALFALHRRLTSTSLFVAFECAHNSLPCMIVTVSTVSLFYFIPHSIATCACPSAASRRRASAARAAITRSSSGARSRTCAFMTSELALTADRAVIAALMLLSFLSFTTRQF